MTKNLNWGIKEDLQTDIRYEPNACKSYVLDLSLNCPYNCIYCIFSPLEKKAYKVMNPEYKGEVIPLKLDEFMKREKFPPKVYLSYASEPLANPEITKLTVKALEKLLANDVFVLIISKGIFTSEVVDVIKKSPDLVKVQIGVANTDDRRNEIVEPGAPSYKERLNNFTKLISILDSQNLIARIDPLLPTIDDKVSNIKQIINDISEIGVEEAVISYVNLTKQMIKEWKKKEFVRSAAEMLTEKVPTITSEIGNKELYSIPAEKKKKKLNKFKQICNERNVNMKVCGCKDLRFKEMEYNHLCLPSRLETANLDVEKENEL
jgi:DNA repair photolyase